MQAAREPRRAGTFDVMRDGGRRSQFLAHLHFACECGRIFDGDAVRVLGGDDVQQLVAALVRRVEEHLADAGDVRPAHVVAQPADSADTGIVERRPGNQSLD
jgi:hypothetical protein